MPFMSYNTGIRDAIVNAGRMMKAGGCDAVKLEGGVDFAPVVQAMVKAGIPVQGHVGLTPQTASALGGFRTQGKDAAAARKIIDDARALEAAGATIVNGSLTAGRVDLAAPSEDLAAGRLGEMSRDGRKAV